MSKAYLLGFIAAANDRGKDTCPYTDGFPASDEWLKGYIAADDWWDEPLAEAGQS